VPGITAQQRDWDHVRSGLIGWLQQRWPEAEGLQLGPFSVNEANGFSNESVFFDATFTEQGQLVERSLVARLPPFGGGLFPEYDLETQFRIQDAIGRHGVPVAAQVGFEGEKGWVGSSFIVMERVEGLVATDNPLYCISGWLKELDSAAQRQVCQGAIEALVAVHRLDWAEMGLDFVARREGIGLRGELDWWAGYLDWASDARPPAPLADALAWCEAHRPDPEPPPVLLWGDARLGNIIFGHDQHPAALLDWEMASIGPPEVDLGWFTATRTQTRVLAGGLPDPELPGFLRRQETIEYYESKLGRPVQSLAWYEVFAMLRWGICIASIHRLLRQLGVTEHFIFESPLLPEWTIDIMNASQ
jgi:aminoglycoside phosphotransferase (APT) family kinase protein